MSELKCLCEDFLALHATVGIPLEILPYPRTAPVRGLALPVVPQGTILGLVLGLVLGLILRTILGTILGTILVPIFGLKNGEYGILHPRKRTKRT